eukprot:m.248485 g.248485  ORF g.248485 m.248485 type:complete len:69 (+) comp17502_c0_seq12:3791-3997(+)
MYLLFLKFKLWEVAPCIFWDHSLSNDSPDIIMTQPSAIRMELAGVRFVNQALSNLSHAVTPSIPGSDG